MLVAVLASRILGLVRDILIARQFGQGGAVSAYTAAFNIPDLLYFFLSSGALSSAFIPVFTERFNTGRQKEAWQIFSIIACLMGVVLTVAVVVFWVYAKPLVSLLAVPGFVDKYPKLVTMTVFLTRVILPCQLFFFLGGLMMGTLESRQKFSARAAGPVIYNVGIIFGAIILARWFHIAGLAWGALIGAFAGNIGYAYYCLRKEGYEFHPSLNIRHPGVVRVGQLALPVVLGLSLPQIDVIINRYFASFVSDSAPAALQFANRLMQVPLGIFAQAAGTAILPMLAAYAAQNAIKEMRSGVGYGLRTILIENIPATFFMVVMADPIVRAVYMSGEFRPSDVPVTAVALAFYSAGIFAWAGQAIVARGFFALQDTITPVVIGTVSTAVFVPTNYYLMKYMGVGGIALSTTIAATLHFLLLTIFLRKRLRWNRGPQDPERRGPHSCGGDRDGWCMLWRQAADVKDHRIVAAPGRRFPSGRHAGGQAQEQPRWSFAIHLLRLSVDTRGAIDDYPAGRLAGGCRKAVIGGGLQQDHRRPFDLHTGDLRQDKAVWRGEDSAEAEPASGEDRPLEPIAARVGLSLSDRRRRPKFAAA